MVLLERVLRIYEEMQDPCAVFYSPETQELIAPPHVKPEPAVQV
jgi:hypothetical protein